MPERQQAKAVRRQVRKEGGDASYHCTDTGLFACPHTGKGKGKGGDNLRYNVAVQFTLWHIVFKANVKENGGQNWVQEVHMH